MNASRKTDPAGPGTRAAMERWVRRRSGSALLARAVAMAVEAEAQGHACALLAPDGIDLAALRELKAWVGDGAALTPAVLSEHGEFFLWRNWRHEERIAAAIAARVDPPAAAPDPAVEADLECLFAGPPPPEEDPVAAQHLAVRAVVGKRFFMLSGGPGTGKTSTVLRMLLMLQRVAWRTGHELSMALAAPTGKAAQRLSQALRDGSERLRAQLRESEAGWHAALDGLPASACTLHRLLGFQPDTCRPRFDTGNPLPFDLVVVDEASMVDLSLMRALLDALAPDSRLILIGDPDQLVSVSAGSVLADLVQASAQPPLAHHHVRLRHVWRTQGRLAEVYAAVRSGSLAALAPLFEPDVGAHWQRVGDGGELGRRLQSWVHRAEWASLDSIAAAEPADPARAFAALRQLQLLTALREGPFGSIAINAWLDAARRGPRDGSPWYPGRPVIVRHNDHHRRLFNGDVGLAMRHQGQLVVCFESTAADGRIEHRHLSPRELPEHDLGYALTVHKSQGSEYEHVAVLLPPESDNRILSRQLLYTGISRAKRSLEIWSSEASLRAALDRVGLRHGGLRRRLAALTCPGSPG